LELLFEQAETVPEPEQCKGLVFRGYNSTFKSGNHVGRHQGIKLLKRQSCPGCEKCYFLLDFVSEDIYCGSLEMPEIENGELYSIEVVVDGRDWETGYVDDCHARVYKIESDFIGSVKP